MAADESDAATFSRQLASLKRQGCNVLVVNDRQASDVICERLLGGHDLERRHLFLPTTTPVDEVLDRHRPRRTDPGALGVLDATGANLARSITVDSSTGPDLDGTAGGEWYESIDDLSDLEALFESFRTHLERIEPAAPAPGEVRFCLDSIDPFFDAVDEEELFRFVHLVTSAIRERRGMGHFHATATIGNPVLSTIEPLFDATIYVDVGPDGEPKQRWRLHEHDLLTDWFTLD